MKVDKGPTWQRLPILWRCRPPVKNWWQNAGFIGEIGEVVYPDTYGSRLMRAYDEVLTKDEKQRVLAEIQFQLLLESFSSK